MILSRGSPLVMPFAVFPYLKNRDRDPDSYALEKMVLRFYASFQVKLRHALAFDVADGSGLFAVTRHLNELTGSPGVPILVQSW
jgi:hypothetical protein